MFALTVLVLLAVAWSLWVRRFTWRCRWEVAATLNVALMGLAAFLISPMAAATLGHWLHALTGEWNLQNYLGHDAWIVAASCICCNAVGRLRSVNGLDTQTRFKLWVEYPATLVIPINLALFTLSGATKTYYADMFRDAPTNTNGWLIAYWMVLGATLAHLALYGCRALWLVRRDPRSRRIANIHLLAAGLGALAAIIRVVAAPFNCHDGTISLTLCFACGIIFALISAHSWQAKVRPYRNLARMIGVRI